MKQEKIQHVKRWDVFEISLSGPSNGNPFTEQTLTGVFTSEKEKTSVNGFYDEMESIQFVLCHPLKETIPISCMQILRIIPFPDHLRSILPSHKLMDQFM